MNIKEILAKHQKWLNGEAGGERANLSGADLSGADLSRANLSWANKDERPNAILEWNTRAPILSESELKKLEETT